MSTNIEMTAIEVCAGMLSIVDDLLTSLSLSHVIVTHSSIFLAIEEIKSLKSCQQPEKVVVF